MKSRMSLGAIAVTLRGASVAKKSISQNTDSGSLTNGSIWGFSGRDFLSLIFTVRGIARIFIVFAVFAMGGLSEQASAFTQVLVSTAAPVGIEQQFLASTTNQYLSQLIVNPLAANTYQLKILGLNPTYNPPPSNTSLLSTIIQLSTQSFGYGFADGMTYQQNAEEGVVGVQGNLCASATFFVLTQTSTKTFDRSTCQDVIATIETQLFQMSLSTPTVFPPEP